MLSLAFGSKCDVCFEAFGKELKAPCSITCGHVFCSDCIHNISRSCPLCRTHFDQDSWIKLHVDVEPSLDCSPDDVNEAERLHAAIVNLAEAGTDETSAKQQIHDTKHFLGRHAKDLFKDLRVLLRMFIFMCETKTNLRAQRNQNDVLVGQLHNLSEERVDLMKRLAASEEARKYERDTALAVERSLREHNALAVRNYTLLIQAVSIILYVEAKYNKLAQSTADLLKQPHTYPYTSSEKVSGLADGILTPFNTLLPTIDNTLEGVAIQDSESSFMISPLAQFTGVLPSFLDSLTPLPELTEDDEGEEKEEEEEISTPDSIQDGRDMEDTHAFRDQPSGESLRSRPLDYSQESKPSGLTHTAPYHRARSRSIPSRSTSPSKPPSQRSASASPPTAPQHHLMPPANVRPSSYPHNTRESYGSSSSRHPDGDALRSRLHDILSDTPTSSSLPNMSSSHGASSFTSTGRGVPARTPSSSPPTIRNGAMNSGRPPMPSSNSSSDGVSHLLASGPKQQIQNKHAPAPSPGPFLSQRYSSASSEAKKLEEERRRKQREERQREDRERYRDGEVRRRDDRYGMDHEPRAPTHEERASSTASTRRDQPANQNYNYSSTVNSNPPSLKRRPSSGNTYGQPTVVPPVPVQEHASGHHARYPGVPSGHKSRPVPIPTHSNTYT